MKKGVDKMEWMRYNNKRARRGVAQFGRVLGLGPRCRRFESCHLDHMQNGLDAKFDAFKPFFIKLKNLTMHLTHKLYSVFPKVCNFFV